MTTQWTCPKCGAPAHTDFVVVTDAKPGSSVWDGERRYFATRCTNSTCVYRDGFPKDDPAIPQP